MEGIRRRWLAMGIAALLCLFWMPRVGWAAPLSETARAYLLLEVTTRTILEEKNADEALHGASVTKLMSYLLFFEALQQGSVQLQEEVTVSKEAASKKGTSAFLDTGEQQPLEALLKASIVGSANDATCALAEKIAGSEAAFVERMNARADQLGVDAVFADCTGLSEQSLVSAAAFADIAAELCRHSAFFEYSACWTYSLVHASGRETEITNANTLVRDGLCDGMATGSTSASGYSMVASAKNGNARFLCVILGDREAGRRASAAKRAISEATAAYGVKQIANRDTKYRTIPLENADPGSVDLYPSEDLAILYRKGEEKSIRTQVEIDEGLAPPICLGQIAGRIVVDAGGTQYSVALEAREAVEQRSLRSAFGRILHIWLEEAAAEAG